MSTRCQIEFQTKTRDELAKDLVLERRLIYQHSNGDPDSVLPCLRKFFEWNIDRATGKSYADRVCYTAANYVYWSKRNLEKHFDEESAKTGFGVCNVRELEPDIEFFYIVRTNVTYSRSEFKGLRTHLDTRVTCFEAKKRYPKKPCLHKIREEPLFAVGAS